MSLRNIFHLSAIDTNFSFDLMQSSFGFDSQMKFWELNKKKYGKWILFNTPFIVDDYYVLEILKSGVYFMNVILIKRLLLFLNWIKLTSLTKFEIQILKYDIQYRSIICILGQGKTICNLGQGDFQWKSPKFKSKFN
jgi:hypothetical protein